MITILTAKYLLSGVIKKMVIEPVVSTTLSIIPKSTLIQTHLFGQELVLSTSDLIKFGIDKLYQKYGEEELTFNIEKMQNNIYQVVPANNLARRFFKEYNGIDQLLVDLSAVDQYLDLLLEEDLARIDDLENSIFENDKVMQQAISDIDLAVTRSKRNHFNTATKEQQLVEAVLNKNSKLVEQELLKRERKLRGPRSAVDAILTDFPEIPFEPQTDEEKIDEILNKLSQDTSTGVPPRRRVT